jgi:hypothetical protein
MPTVQAASGFVCVPAAPAGMLWHTPVICMQGCQPDRRMLQPAAAALLFERPTQMPWVRETTSHRQEFRVEGLGLGFRFNPKPNPQQSSNTMVKLKRPHL